MKITYQGMVHSMQIDLDLKKCGPHCKIVILIIFFTYKVPNELNITARGEILKTVLHLVFEYMYHLYIMYVTRVSEIRINVTYMCTHISIIVKVKSVFGQTMQDSSTLAYLMIMSLMYS